MTKKGNKCERRCRASTTGVDGKHDGINKHFGKLAILKLNSPQDLAIAL